MRRPPRPALRSSSCNCHGSQYSALTGEVQRGPATQALPAATITVSGGPMLSGKYRGTDIGSGTNVWSMSEDLRAGKIIGTAALFSIRARQPLGLVVRLSRETATPDDVGMLRDLIIHEQDLAGDRRDLRRLGEREAEREIAHRRGLCACVHLDAPDADREAPCRSSPAPRTPGSGC